MYSFFYFIMFLYLCKKYENRRILRGFILLLLSCLIPFKIVQYYTIIIIIWGMFWGLFGSFRSDPRQPFRGIHAPGLSAQLSA